MLAAISYSVLLAIVPRAGPISISIFLTRLRSQFYVKHASSSLKIADKFSHKNPLNAEKVWQKLELKHIVQAVSNVQNSNFVICFLDINISSLSETTSFVFLFS